jgi:hypothetical protein
VLPKSFGAEKFVRAGRGILEDYGICGGWPSSQGEEWFGASVDLRGVGTGEGVELPGVLRAVCAHGRALSLLGGRFVVLGRVCGLCGRAVRGADLWQEGVGCQEHYEERGE